jgi:hypothetical protein
MSIECNKYAGAQTLIHPGADILACISPDQSLSLSIFSK